MTVERRNKRRHGAGGHTPVLTVAAAVSLSLAWPVAAEEPAQANPDSLRAWLQRSNAVYSLHEAAEAGDVAVLQARLAEGADTEAKDELGRTPLYLAAQRDRQAAVALLLESGADISACDAAGKGVLSFYAGKPLPPAVEKACRLLDCCRQAVEAVAQGDAAKLKSCLAQGLNPNARYESHYLLQYALAKGDAALAEVLLAAGASPNVLYPDGKSALHIAAGRGLVDVAKVLVTYGADPFLRAANGATPLHEAVWCQQYGALDYLLPLYKYDNFNPEGKPLPVCMAIGRGQTKVLEIFLRHGMKVNDRRFAPIPLLTLAVRAKNAEAVRLLLQAGADKTAIDQDGRRAADYAEGDLKALLQ